MARRGGDVERRAPGTHCARTKAAPDAAIIAATAPRMHHRRRLCAFQSPGTPNGAAAAAAARPATPRRTLPDHTAPYRTIPHHTAPYLTYEHHGIPRHPSSRHTSACRVILRHTSIHHVLFRYDISQHTAPYLDIPRHTTPDATPRHTSAHHAHQATPCHTVGTTPRHTTSYHAIPPHRMIMIVPFDASPHSLRHTASQNICVYCIAYLTPWPGN